MKSYSKLIYIICGPTASGKTHLAHILATKIKGEIIGADSMQIYKEIPIITASPSNQYKSELPYHMYNFLSISDNYSVIKYILAASDLIKEISIKGNTPIIVGGTGLYIDGLINGYNNIPSINDDIRFYVRNMHETLGQEEFFQKLVSMDFRVINRLKSADKTRSLRAFEIFIQTGKSIFEFQEEENHKTLRDFTFKVIFINPNRQFLYENCSKRLQNIIANGAIDEVNNLKKNFDTNTININAIAIKQLLSYLNGNITLNEAIIDTECKTRQYAKRQITWFKHKLQNSIEINYTNYNDYKKLDLSKF